MKKLLLSFVLLAAICGVARAQDDLFGTEQKPARKGVILGLNGNFDMPAADMAKRFGASYRVGGAVHYKTTSNWMIGAKMDFILGNKIKEDSLMANVMDRDKLFINIEGERVGVRIYERGYMAGVQLGRIFSTSKSNKDNGILVMTSAGFMQHKINIFDRDATVIQVKGDYKKGYDRLANGWFVGQYIGYNYFGNNALVNFHIGLDFVAGFTQGRREWLFDVMRPGNERRVDILFGVRAGWYLPLFKRKSEDYYFE